MAPRAVKEGGQAYFGGHPVDFGLLEEAFLGLGEHEALEGVQGVRRQVGRRAPSGVLDDSLDGGERTRCLLIQATRLLEAVGCLAVAVGCEERDARREVEEHARALKCPVVHHRLLVGLEGVRPLEAELQRLQVDALAHECRLEDHRLVAAHDLAALVRTLFRERPRSLAHALAHRVALLDELHALRPPALGVYLGGQHALEPHLLRRLLHLEGEHDFF